MHEALRVGYKTTMKHGGLSRWEGGGEGVYENGIEMGWDADRSQFKTINRQHTCSANNAERSHAITTRYINQRLHAHNNHCGMDVLSVITMGKLSANPTLTCANLVPNLVPTLCQASPTRFSMAYLARLA